MSELARREINNGSGIMGRRIEYTQNDCLLDLKRFQNSSKIDKNEKLTTVEEV